ncbi:MAG TPA: thioredoxin family protein [Segetibacter sp.]
MKTILSSLIIASFILTSCSVAQRTLKVTETRTYEVTHDAESKILKGYIDRATIENDTSFKWFKENMKYGTANAAAVQAFQTNGNNVHFVVFGGTWCHDTQNLLPVFYRLADKGGVSNDKITLVGMDRAKTALNGFEKAFKITNVPTFIVMKDGKEIGRVVEYGKYGAIDKELGEIVAAATSK